MSDQGTPTSGNNDLYSPEYGINRDFFNELREALQGEDYDKLRYIIQPLHPADIALIIEDLNVTERMVLVENIRPHLTGEVLAELEDSVREQIVEQLSNEELAAVISDLDSDDAAHILNDLDDEQQRQVLEAMPEDERHSFEQSLSYPEETAGRLMQTEVVTAHQDWTLGQIVNSLEHYADLPDGFNEVFVVDDQGAPKGRIPLSHLLRHPRRTLASDVMDKELKIVPVTMEKEKVSDLFRHYSLYSVPVVEGDGRLVGMITIDDVVDIINEEAGSEILKMAGVTEEAYHNSIPRTCLSRLPWLIVTCINTLISTKVISFFEGVLDHVVTVAILMPIAASLGGSVGMQVVTIAVRALSTHHLRTDQLLTTLARELSISTLLGLALAPLVLTVVYFWVGDLTIGMILIGALITNIIWAALAGIMVPYILDKLDLDPAISAGPLLSTTTDIIGFSIFLGLATLILM